jgi:hypothetical protein
VMVMLRMAAMDRVVNRIKLSTVINIKPVE